MGSSTRRRILSDCSFVSLRDMKLRLKLSVV